MPLIPERPSLSIGREAVPHLIWGLSSLSLEFPTMSSTLTKELLEATLVV